MLWPRTGVNSFGQDVVSATPTEILVRWLDKQSRVLDAQGNTIAVDATAILDATVDVPVGSIMWLGGLDDIPNQTTLIPTTGLMQVKSFNSTPDLKARHYRRTVGLMRYNDTLPTS